MIGTTTLRQQLVQFALPHRRSEQVCVKLVSSLKVQIYVRFELTSYSSCSLKFKPLVDGIDFKLSSNLRLLSSCSMVTPIGRADPKIIRNLLQSLSRLLEEPVKTLLLDIVSCGTQATTTSLKIHKMVFAVDSMDRHLVFT
jgi:hypothetical protein